MYVLDEVGERLADRRPAPLTELLNCRSLGSLPERQCLEESGSTGGRQGQNAAAVPPFRAQCDVALLRERPQVSRQRRAFHLQRIGQRRDRKRAARADRRQDRNLGSAQSGRPQRLVIGAGDDARGHARVVAQACVEEGLRQGRDAGRRRHIVHIHYMRGAVNGAGE